MNEKRIGETGAVTGFETPDPKDTSPSTTFTTTPAADRVSAGEQQAYQPVDVPPAKEVTGQFDHLATRNVTAMEVHPQAPEFAGSQTVVDLGTSVNGAALDTAANGPDFGVATGHLPVTPNMQDRVDPNPNYTPPSMVSPPHVSERPADLPAGETPDLQNEVNRNGKL